MVRLKVYTKVNGRKTFIFQFLMVRLKGRACKKFNEKSLISIPYGAIKRMVQGFADGRQNWISIPYGAIKRIPRMS